MPCTPPSPSIFYLLSPAARVRRLARRFWRGFREWCGDAAYELYLRSRVTRRDAHSALTAEQFYLDQLNRRYSRPNRCC
jgi:uncharacterized short protein YbdD (DUF466 family)